MNKNSLILIVFPFILSLNISSSIISSSTYESKEAELIHSASSLFIFQKDSVLYKKYNSAKNLYQQDEYYKSLAEAIYIIDNSDNIELTFNSYKLIANIYESINDHKKVIFYYKKILDFVKNKNNFLDFDSNELDVILSKTYLKIGSSYTFIPKRDSAIYYFEKILNINSLNKEVRLNQGASSNTLSGIYFYFEDTKDLIKAEKYAKRAIKVHEELNDNLSLTSGYTNLGSIYMEKNNPIKAKELYFKALEYIKNDNRLKAVKYREVIYDNIGWAMYNLEDYIAYDYLDKSITIRDSLRDVSKADIIKELEIKYNNDKQLSKFQNQKQLAERNTWLIGITSFALIALLFYLISVYKLRQQKLQNKFSKNELIQQKNIEKIKSEAQTKILNATLDGKESERKEIAETLHDNVSALLSSANLHLQASQKNNNGSLSKDLQKTQKIIIEASQQIRDLSHNLVSSILLKFGLEYAIKDNAEKYSNSQITFNTQLDNLRRYNQDFEIKVYNIIQEFSNNIIKHSKANVALISLNEKDGLLELSIEDNGIGFNSEESINNGGIGLNQINARVKMLKGTFNIVSSENPGTVIKVVLPIQEREIRSLSFS